MLSKLIDKILIIALVLVVSVTAAYAAFDPCDGNSWARPCADPSIGGYNARVNCCTTSCQNYCHTTGVALGRTYCTNHCPGE